MESKKRKILLLSDDMRLPSGVGGVSKHIILGTLDTFDWVQLGAAINHPDKGKVFDMSEEASRISGVEGASVKLYPWAGYGDEGILRQLIYLERPDAIMHFTDPRFWGWLYQMEKEIRQNIPIIYYNIWDNVGTPPNFSADPHYNAEFYASCDSLYCISKQTYGMVKRVVEKRFGDEFNYVTETESTGNDGRDISIKYVPHGVDTNVFKPLKEEECTDVKTQLIGDRECNFMLFFNSRNIRRKMVPDVILSFNDFLMSLSEEERLKSFLVMNTTGVDQNGTDLYAVIESFVDSPYRGQFLINEGKLSDSDLNKIYNLSDATIGIASNEGFGLSTAESISAGTPIIVNVTGGLQDQCGFKFRGSDNYITSDDYYEIGTLHEEREYKDAVTWGEWAFPIWPATRSLVGSPPTPYIFDDRVDNYDVTSSIMDVYKLGRDERKRRGLVGRQWLEGEGNLNKKHMCELFKKYITDDIENFKPRKRYEVIKA